LDRQAVENGLPKLRELGSYNTRKITMVHTIVMVCFWNNQENPRETPIDAFIIS